MNMAGLMKNIEPLCLWREGAQPLEPTRGPAGGSLRE
jgi:hypothetical protein